MSNPSFLHNVDGLRRALSLMQDHGSASLDRLPKELPEHGAGEDAVLEMLAPIVLGGARQLGARTAFAHMDPPTPWITWAMALWNASLNQNLLHPDVAPVARDVEARIVRWLAPEFGMDGGHMTPGSSVSNITGLWAAREITGARSVVSSSAAHLSITKAANLLGLDHQIVPVDALGQIDATALGEISDSILVLTAGTTNTGAIDPLELAGQAAWTHVDAAWCGPMRLSAEYTARLDSIDCADSVAVSAHKWFFQPKESALIFFQDSAKAHDALTFGGSYLSAPNIGVLGSHGAVAVPLLATLMTFGRRGIGDLIDVAMVGIEKVRVVLKDNNAEVHPASSNGVLLWRDPNRTADEIIFALPPGSASTTKLDGIEWVRHVAANPNFHPGEFCEVLQEAVWKHSP